MQANIILAVDYDWQLQSKATYGGWSLKGF